tara:strand:- start:15950 stop:16531 length:582 start_codon:yes stop_codon:yes gene_type:complete
MNSIKEIAITFALTAFLGLGFASCAALEGVFGEGTVFTTADQLEEGQQGAVIPFDQLPDSVKSKIPEGTSVVMANKDQLKDGAAFIPAGGDMDGDSIGGMIDAGFGLASTFIPGLAAWEGVVTLFSQRKRKHYGKALKAIVPTDKNMDFGGAMGSVASALGLSHSSTATKAMHDEELETEKVATVSAKNKAKA